MRILYIGDSDPAATAYHRSRALERLGHQVVRLNPWALLRRRPTTLDYRSGYRLLQHAYRRALQQWFATAQQEDPQTWDLAWVDSGEWFAADTVELIKQRCRAPVLLYQIDDCTGRRDGHRFACLRGALPHYDLCVTVRDCTELDMRAMGAKRTLRVWMSHDEVAHRPSQPSRNRSADGQGISGSIGFIGTLIPGEGRDHVLLHLLKAEIPLSLWGSRWTRSRHWRRLKPSFRGPFVSGSALSAAMAEPAACLGLLSGGNRDLHTTRSLEVPSAGGLLCAQRTSEHALLYDEGEEAVFWSDAEECRRQCQNILANPAEAERIRVAGCRRILRHGLGNEDICRQILAHLAET